MPLAEFIKLKNSDPNRLYDYIQLDDHRFTRKRICKPGPQDAAIAFLEASLPNIMLG